MITAKTLRDLLEKLPDDATLKAYEGEGIGLIVKHTSGASGWIETGYEEHVEAQPSEHDLGEFAAIR